MSYYILISIDIKFQIVGQKFQVSELESFVGSFNFRNGRIWLRKQIITNMIQKQPSRGVLRKRWSENMQQIYRTPMPKWNFNKTTKQLYWNHTSTWVQFSDHLRTPLEGYFWWYKNKVLLSNIRVFTNIYM